MQVKVILLVTVIFALGSISAENASSSSLIATRQARFEQMKKDIQSFISTKNLLKTVIKILFGSNEESAATSRQVLNVLVQALDLIRNTLSQRARSSNKGFKEAFEDAKVAGVTMLRGYVKSVLSEDEQCVQRHLCDSSREAVREGRELGYVISQVGGYASSYLLQQKSIRPVASFEAVRRGRNNEDCARLYPDCNETD